MNTEFIAKNVRVKQQHSCLPAAKNKREKGKRERERVKNKTTHAKKIEREKN